MVTDKAQDVYGEGRFEIEYDSEELEKKYSQIVENAIKELESKGIAGKARPRITQEHLAIFGGFKAGEFYDGTIPPSVKNLSLDSLSDLFSLVLHWYGYLRSEQARYKAMKSQAKDLMEVNQAMVRKLKSHDADGKKVADQLVRDIARTDHNFVNADVAYETASVLYDLVDAQRVITAHELEMLSRQLTIRQIQIEGQARQRGFNANAKRYAWKEAAVENDEVRFDRVEQENTHAEAAEKREPDAGTNTTAAAAGPKRRIRTDFRVKPNPGT